MQGADAGELAGMPGLVPHDDEDDSLFDHEADGYASEEAGADEHGQSFIHVRALCQWSLAIVS